MLALNASTPIYLYRDAADMRKSYDRLSGVVRAEMDADPLICVRREYVAAARDAVCAQKLRPIHRSRSAPHNLRFKSAPASEAPRP